MVHWVKSNELEASNGIVWNNRLQASENRWEMRQIQYMPWLEKLSCCIHGTVLCRQTTEDTLVKWLQGMCSLRWEGQRCSYGLDR